MPPSSTFDTPLAPSADIADVLEEAADVANISDDMFDNRHMDDFDFSAIVAELPLANTAECMETLDLFRKPFIAAARREGKRNPGAAYYHAVNAPLFTWRKLLQFQISAVTASDAATYDASRAASEAYAFAVSYTTGGPVGADEADALAARFAHAASDLASPGDSLTPWKKAATALRSVRKAGADGERADLNVETFIELANDIAERIAFRATIGYEPEDVKETIRVADISLEYITELLIVFNHGLALKYARKFTSNTSREDSADMQAAANLGLMRAIASYDPKLGLFGSWAFKPVQRDTLKAVRDVDFSNMTHGDFERRPLILRSLEVLTELNPDTPVAFEDVAAHAGCTLELVQRVLAAPHLDSIHTPVGDEGNTELGDLIPDTSDDVDDMVISALEIDALKTFGLPLLEPRERYVIVRRFGLHGEPCEALSDIGKDLGLSRESVRQHANKGLSRLLHPMCLGAIVRGGAPS